MRSASEPCAAPLFLGIECGGTRTVALCANHQGELVRRVAAGPANLQLVTDAQLVAHFKGIARQMPPPSAVGIGMAGARTARDWERICRLAAQVWPHVPCRASHDLETALLAAGSQDIAPGITEAAPGITGVQSAPEITGARSAPGLSLSLSPSDGERAGERGTSPRMKAEPRVLVLSGTGSCCYGRSPAGKIARIGGWGHLLGDKGSGYEIGLRALKAVVYYYDRDGVWSALGRRILRGLELNEPNELIAWIQSAGKEEVAALAVEVFAAAAKKNKIATDILVGAASSLAKDAVACAQRLARKNRPVAFVFAGSILTRQPAFAAKVRQRIQAAWPVATFLPLNRESAWGAVELARQQFATNPGATTVPTKPKTSRILPLSPSEGERVPAGRERGHPRRSARAKLPETLAPWDVHQLSASPTEQRNARSTQLDQMPLAEAIALMLDEDAQIPRAILAERKQIEWTIQRIVRAFRRGGRLFYVGAGTSGRLGVLDASECPPTFRTPPDLVQGVIAGGQRALSQAVEGAEDDPDAGARAMEFRGVERQDVVVGIAASGRTPFVWGALWEARRRGATTVLLCFNPALRVARKDRPHRIIAPNLGPEILTGSTRLKSGTATKLILNIFTTLAMVRLGKVIGNLMVDLNPSNVKLRDRAERIVQELTGATPAAARVTLENCNWSVPAAVKKLRSRGKP